MNRKNFFLKTTILVPALLLAGFGIFTLPENVRGAEDAPPQVYDPLTGEYRSMVGEVRTTNLTYVPLEPFPGINQTGQASFGELVGGLFKILINVGAFLAVVILVLGGITYMVSESTVTKLAGKEKVKAALIGIGILGASWLILNTINPDLITFDKELLAPADSDIIVYSPATLGKDGVERRPLTREEHNKLRKEFGCPRHEFFAEDCVQEDILVFDPKRKTTRAVTEEIQKFKKDCDNLNPLLKKVWGTKQKLGSLVGEPGASVMVCKMI